MKKLPIQITFDFEENEYMVFAKGIDLVGHGETESKALLNFLQNFENLNDKLKVLDKSTIISLIKTLELETENEF